MKIRTSNSNNHFIDTNVILQHANGSGDWGPDLEQILREAVGDSAKRLLWVSSVIFSELRPSSLRSDAKFKSINDIAKYIRSIATVIEPTPQIGLRAARLRDCRWQRPSNVRNSGEKPRCMTLGDAIHLSSALWVKEATGINDLEFLTFDKSADKSVETDQGTKSLPILSLEDFTDGISSDPDVAAVVSLRRVRPILPQTSMDFSTRT